MWFPPIYKFLNSAHVPALLRRGRLKIGTSVEYRIPDGKDGARSDPTELTRVWKPEPGLHVMGSDHPFIRYFGTQLKPGQTLKLWMPEDVTFRVGLTAFIFSASREYSDELAERMRTEFDADACVCISDPQRFMDLLSQHTLLHGRRSHLDFVDYGDSNEYADFGQAEPFKKLNHFAWQKEFRLVWQASNDADVGSVIEVPEVVPLLTRIR
jgi:hypothetical protein